MALATVVFKEPTLVIVNHQRKVAKVVSLPHDQAVSLWLFHEGGKKPTSKALAAKLSRIRRIYLNRKLAPAAYVEKHPVDQERPKLVDARPWYKDVDNIG